MAEAVARQCGQCGNDISNEEIANRQAGLVAGTLLCPACVELKRKEMLEQHRAAAAAAAAATPVGHAVPQDITAEKIALADDQPMAGQPVRKIRSFAEGSSLGGVHHDVNLKRAIAGADAPATRCRTFHGKLTPTAISHMDDLINEWIDANDGVYIKNMAMTVGLFEAKHAEPHLIVTVFY